MGATQKTGAEIATWTMTDRTRSGQERGHSAPTSPTGMAMSSHSTAAPASSDSVTVTAGKISSETGPPQDERVAEIAVRQLPQKPAILLVPRAVGAQQRAYFGHPFGAGGLARHTLRGIRAGRLCDDEEQDVGDQRDQQDLEDRDARSAARRRSACHAPPLARRRRGYRRRAG